MLQEYALDPSLLSKWSDFRFYMSQFGFDRGRLIARYPKRWKRLVYDSLDCPDIERAKIVEALHRFVDARLVSRRADSWHPQRDWLANAESEHADQPFWAILAKSNPRSHADVIIGDEVHDDLDWDTLLPEDSRRLWKASRSRIIQRTAPEMAEVIEPFLHHADQILFVDKHFGLENRRYSLPFAEYFQRLHDRPSGRMPGRLEVHCSNRSEVGFFRTQCQSTLENLIPLNTSVRFFRWEDKDLHNRFVLTEQGGVAFLEGLDQFLGNGREKDVVVLLDRDVAQKLMQDFLPDSKRFTLRDECQVQGKLPVA